MEAVLPLLAIAGGAAVGFRLLRSVVRFGITLAEGTAITGLAEVSARRGDLTTLAEHRDLQRTVRRARRREALRLAAWFLVLVVPVALAVATPVYAAAALLWFVPARPLRITTVPAREPE
ncbi:MAG TPA: hypothetical protein VFE05_03465 [Longimicrobiaceae bacterium]|nr:hypothetical protein [Longimicrobiaceae bacterium]